MASPIEITNRLIEPLESFLGGLKHPNPEAYFQVYFEVLERFTVYQIERALSDIKASWKYKNWPSPADIAERCGHFPAEEPKPRAERPEKRDKSKFDYKHCFSRLTGPMAVDAAQNGWALQLFHWLEEHGELPFPEDEQRLKAEASQLWAKQEDVLRGEWVGPDGEVQPLKAAPAVQAMVKAMRDREARIAAHILNTNTTREAG